MSRVGALRLPVRSRGAIADRREGAQTTLARIAELHGPDASLRGIAAALPEDGVMAHNGRPFAPITLSRLGTK